MAEYSFENTDGDLDVEEPSKAGFTDRWVGIANATDHSYVIETHIEASVPKETSGNQFYKIQICSQSWFFSAWEFEVGGGEILGILGFPVFKVNLNLNGLDFGKIYMISVYKEST